MAQSDLETFILERASAFDETLDVSSGSPFDVQVVQPILRRLGTDPFTVNFSLFAQERLNQEFPDLATKEGDAVSDLVIKTNSVLWAPIIREIQRVQNNLSLRDPTILTLDEAEALGANIFSDRDRGTFTKGQARIYFAQPQSTSVSPANFFTSKTGLHFYPTSVQSIRVDEMLLNLEGSLYYFDVNVVAEKPGDSYNIGQDELVSIANLTAAVRITNKRRFRFGTPEEDAPTYIGRTQQSLTERSLVTLRGIGAQISSTFPEVSTLAVVGFNDPEMDRDVLTGGSFGPIQASGFLASPVADGENNVRTRRIDLSADAIDATVLIGAAGPIANATWFLTLVNAFGTDTPKIRDIAIQSIVSTSQVDLVDQVVVNANVHYTWMLRKKEITISEIPGGILFPEGPSGTVSVPDGNVHIGGATDVFVRGVAFDSSSVVIKNIVDESPILSGTKLQILDGSGHVVTNDFILSANYQTGDSTYNAFIDAKAKGFSLDIIEGPASGSYRVIDVVQSSFAAVILTLDPIPLAATGTDYRWRLLDVLDLDLVEPKETRISASDGIAVQGVDSIESGTGLDFQALGVSVGDIVRILNGSVLGDYTVKTVLAPFFDRIQVDRALTHSVSDLSYTIFRPNVAGGVKRPLVRITSVDLLDTSGQPVGSKIPYAKPIDIRTRSFANVSHGVKVDVRDAYLGLASQAFASGSANLSGQLLNCTYGIFPNSTGPFPTHTIHFSGGNPVALQTAADQINTAFGSIVAYVVDGTHLGIVSPSGEMRVTGGAAATLFGDFETHSSRDVRSATVNAAPINGWSAVNPPVEDTLDILQVLDGFQIGPYSDPSIIASALQSEQNFAPEVNRHIQLGARSIGSARLYFLEPTSVEFGAAARLQVTSNGFALSYKPDPTNSFQKIPGLPSGIKPTDGSVVSAPSTFFNSASVDFVAKAILPGDQLAIDYIPLRGTASLADPVLSSVLRTLILSVDGGTDKTITFINDSTSIDPNAVTRNGIASQINRTVGKVICAIVTVGSLQYLQFSFDGSIVVRRTGTANSLLGFSTITDRNNDSPNKGLYTINSVATNTLGLSSALSTNQENQGFKVVRPGAQRISATQMSSNKESGSLYYMDLELVSEGTGDMWNIAPGLQMTATNFDSDGYYLSTSNADLSFSPIEDIHMHLSRSILDIGVDDDPENSTQLSGQNIQVNYEMSTLTSNVNNFLTAETERVINSSPLGRHLTPFFVRFDLSYIGGSKENVVVPELEKLIQATTPNEPLEVSDIEKVVLNKGASSIQNPIDLIAIVHQSDRSITTARSNDALKASRLAAFVPDVLNVTRRIS